MLFILCAITPLGYIAGALGAPLPVKAFFGGIQVVFFICGVIVRVFPNLVVN